MSNRALWEKRSKFFCVFWLTVLASACAQQRDPIVITISPQSAAVATGATTQFSAAGDSAGVTWSVLGFSSGVPVAAGTIDTSGNYTAPAGARSLVVRVTATSKRDQSKFASALVNVIAPGQVTATSNVQVAQYTISPPAYANVSVQFGTDMTYGLTTWTQPTPMGLFGGPVSLFVAGMKASTLYHMRGVVQFADGTQFFDSDQMFTTGALPAAMLPSVAATTTPGMTPQSGVELLALLPPFGVSTNLFDIAVTDLAGNVIWAYNPNLPPVLINPVKLLSNGHLLLNFDGLVGTDGNNSVLQEVDLAGNLIWQMTAADLNKILATASCAECNVTVIGTHHDFAPLPNGHLIVIASTQMTLSDGTTPIGDVIIDLGDIENVGGKNPSHVPQPVWAWNEFNHLDTNRRPYSYPDWTHTNAIIYSADDGNLIISSRNQNWLIKIDYNNGAGAGDIFWRLGYQGDFTLLNADGSPDPDPTDWFFAQHGPSFVSTNTTGKFSLALFDDGDDRGVVVVSGGTCGVTGQPACFSTAPIFQLDETAKTATMLFNPTTVNYSFFGGNTEVLKNGDVEYDECNSFPVANGAVFEITQTSPPQIVWQMTVSGQDIYRGTRLPSLYPGVQW